MLRGCVTTQKRLNPSDKSRTMYLIWRDTDYATRQCERLFRTESNPTSQSMRIWNRRAQELAFQKQRELEGGERGETRPMECSVKEATERYFVWAAGTKIAPARRSQSTIIRHRRTIGMFMQYLGNHWPYIRRMNQLSARHINGTGIDKDNKPCPVGWAVIRAKQISQASLATELFDLTAWMKWCYRHELMDWPFPFIIPKATAGRALVPSTGRILAAIKAQPEGLRRLVASILPASGMRQGELRKLMLSDYDMENATIIIPREPTERTKLHRRDLPLGWRTAKMLGEYIEDVRPQGSSYLFPKDGKMMNGSQINFWLRKSGVTPHDMRKWFITALEEIECPPGTTDDLAGHAPRGVRGSYTSGLIREDVARKWLQGVEDLLYGGS